MTLHLLHSKIQKEICIASRTLSKHHRTFFANSKYLGYHWENIYALRPASYRVAHDLFDKITSSKLGQIVVSLSKAHYIGYKNVFASPLCTFPFLVKAFDLISSMEPHKRICHYIEIEVNKKILEGHIQPRTSYCGSPIVMATNKNGAWQFYIDY